MKNSPKSSSNTLIIVLALVLIVAIAIAAFLFISKGKDNKIETSEISNETNQETAIEEDSSFVGQSGSCTPLDPNQWYRTGHTLTVDPNNPNTIGVFVEKRGFFKSADGGTTWKYSSDGIKGFRAPDLHKERPCYLEFKTSVLDPSNSKRILLGALGDFDTIDSMFNQAGGLLESKDGGETWNQILTDEVNAYVHDIAIDPTDPNTIFYVTSSQKGANQDASLLTKGLVYKTVDGGKTWRELNTGILPNTGAQNIHINSKNPKQLIVTSSTFARNPSGGRMAGTETLGILTTNDGGETWQGIKSLPEGDGTVLVSF